MAEYDVLIEQAVVCLARSLRNPSPERQAELNDAIDAAAQLRSGRDDGPVARQDCVDVLDDICAAFRAQLKARLLKTLPAKLGGDPAAIERVLDIEMASLIRREEIEALIDAHFAGRAAKS